MLENLIRKKLRGRKNKKEKGKLKEDVFLKENVL